MSQDIKTDLDLSDYQIQTWISEPLLKQARNLN